MTAITQISPAAVRDALATGEILLVDVREPSEYAIERIPGALLHPLSTFDPGAIPYAGRKLVVQCAGGGRSMRAAQALVAAGHAQVANLEGGINAWKAQGLPLIRIDPASGGKKSMSIDRIVFAFAGTVILASLLLGVYVSPNWFWLTAFVGANLLQLSFTGFCPLAMLLRRIGVGPGAAF